MTQAVPDRPTEAARESSKTPQPSPTPEHARLAESRGADAPWRLWGPYLAARQWGTVREDYFADGDAWASFPFDHAHTRADRWGDDGIAGLAPGRPGRSRPRSRRPATTTGSRSGSSP
ncbi:hypothetical protein GCM10028781_11910 [Nostocoides australiense]